MAIRILLIGVRLSRNLGGPSLLPTTMRVIRKVMQDSEFTLISPVREDVLLSEEYGVHIIPAVRWRRILLPAIAKAILGISIGTKEIRQVIESFSQADLVIDIAGIEFADTLGVNAFMPRATQAIHLIVGKIFGKPVVKYTAALGPFETRWNRIFARMYLQHAVDLILARDEVTRQRLDKLGITTRVRVCPDTAFLLDSEMSPLAVQLSNLRKEYPIVGFSVSHMTGYQSGSPEVYLDCMARLADYIIDRVGAKIVLIPNELSPDPRVDDMHYALQTVNRMVRKDEAIVVTGEYAARQLKGIIAQCDVVVAARYHTVVASLSQGIPVLVVGWHDKYDQVLKLVGQQQYLCSVQSLRLEELKEKFDDLWKSKERLKYEISNALPGIRDAVLQGGKEIELLLSKRRYSG